MLVVGGMGMFGVFSSFNVVSTVLVVRCSDGSVVVITTFIPAVDVATICLFREGRNLKPDGKAPLCKELPSGSTGVSVTTVTCAPRVLSCDTKKRETSHASFNFLLGIIRLCSFIA